MEAERREGGRAASRGQGDQGVDEPFRLEVAEFATGVPEPPSSRSVSFPSITVPSPWAKPAASTGWAARALCVWDGAWDQWLPQNKIRPWCTA